MAKGAHYDRLETRPPGARERAQFRDLRAVLKGARGKAPGLRSQLRGLKIEEIADRDILRYVPVLRKSALVDMQRATPPFGGLTPLAPGAFRRLLVSPGPIFEPEADVGDWWGAARALHAAGLRRGDILLNCFSYHLTPGGHIMESGARALGCAVIPGGVGATEAQVEAIHHLRPRAYCGTPDFLKILLDKARELGRDASSIQRAFVSGAALPASLRAELGERGAVTRQGYATAETGVIAYESETIDGALVEGMVVNEHVIVEIVRPGTGDPVPPGEVGEVVVTRLSPHYPLLRLATGDLSAFLHDPSPCGRTNARIRGWMGRADQTAKVRGMFVHPSQVAEIGRRHPELGRLRLVISRANEQDAMVLRAECAAHDEALAARVAETLQAVARLRGVVELVTPGALPNDGKAIADERPAG